MSKISIPSAEDILRENNKKNKISIPSAEDILRENNKGEGTRSTYPFDVGIEPTKVENPYPTFAEQLSASMQGITPKDIAESLPTYKSALDVQEMREQAFQERFTTDEGYRAKWFSENYGMTEDAFKEASVKNFKERLDVLIPRAEEIQKKAVEDNATQRGGTGIIRTIENLGDAMAVKSKIDDLRGISASMDKDNFWSGLYEGVSLLDILSMGLGEYASSKELNSALKKQAEGVELTDKEQFALDASTLYDDINETYELLGGRSGWNKIGQGAGESAEFMAQMGLTGGMGFSTNLMKNLGIKQGVAAVKGAAQDGILQAVGTTLSQGAKVLGKGAYNIGLSYAESIPRAMLMPSTYSRYLELRNERIKEGKPVDGNWLQDAGRAGIEMTNEIASEIWGSRFIYDSFRAMGKALGVDKALNAVGLGRRKRTMFGWTPSAGTREAMRKVGYAGSIPSEVASEAAGDVATNIAMGVFFDDAQWEQMGTADYWITLLGVTAVQGTAIQSANAVLNIPEYNRLNDLEQKRDKALSSIPSSKLRAELEVAFSYDTAEEMGTALSHIDWDAYDKVEVAHAMDAVRLEAPIRVAIGEKEESERVSRFLPYLEGLTAQTYKGVDAENPSPTPMSVVAVTDEGVNVRIDSGDYRNPEAMLNVVDQKTGKQFPIIASRVSDVMEVSLQDRIAEAYKMMFSMEENVQKLTRVMDTLGRLAHYGEVSSRDARGIVERAGYKVFEEGEVVTLVNGQQVEVAAPMMADGHYLVRDIDGNMSSVGLLDIVQPTMEVAEAQIKMASRETQAETAEATTPMPEGVTYGDIYVTPQGIGRVVEYNAETGKVYVDLNLSTENVNRSEEEEIVEVDVADLQRNPSPAEMAEARTRSVRRNALGIQDESSTPIGAIQDVVEEVAQETAIDTAETMEVENAEVEQAPQSVPSMESVPTTEDGAVDYEAITDENLYAKLLTQDIGSKEEALEAVNTSIEGYQAEAVSLQKEAKKEKNMTQRVALTKQAAAMQQKVDMLNKVRDILLPVGLVQDAFTATLPKGEVTLIDSLARSLGLTVEFVDQVAGGQSNAEIIGNKVHIAKEDRDKAIKFLVGHEFTHRMQDLSPEAYAEFKAAVREFMGEEEYQARVQKEIAKYRRAGITRTAEQLEDEVIADFAGSLALETDALDTLIAAHADKKSMWQAILDVLRAIREWILKDTVYDTAEARALQNTIGKLETLFQTASEKVASGEAGIIESKNTRYSVKNKRKKALETVSVPEEHHQTVISSAYGTNILKNIDSAIEEYENAPYTREKTFLGKVAKLLNAEKRGSNSQYATFEAINGKIFTIRLSDHNATINNFDNNNEKEGISIVITPAKNKGVNKGGDAHIVEFFYDSIKLRKAEGKPLAEILKSIKQALYSGEYTDTTGLAQKEEVNALFSLKELDAPYLDAVARGDMATAERMVREAAVIAMPYTKIVDEDGLPKVVYHQTNAKVYINRETGQNWDDLDWRERMEWDERDDWDEYWEEQDFNTFSRVNARTTNEFDGFFFAPEYDDYHEYGDRTISAFLNITNPASREDYDIDSSKNNAGRDERLRLQSEGYDGVIREEDDVIWEYVAFNPNQIKSADPVTYDGNGNVIPLSERFNPEKEDIRYSLRVADIDIYDGKALSLEDVRTIFHAVNTNKYNAKLFDKVYRIAEEMPQYDIMVVDIPNITNHRFVGTASMSGKIRFATRLFEDMDNQKAKTMLHELIHSVTTYATRAYAYKDEDVNYARAYEALPQNIKEACEELQNIYNELSQRHYLEGTYGITNIHEMLAELANPKFREAIVTGGVWDKIVNAVLRLLGIDDSAQKRRKKELKKLKSIVEQFLENYDANVYMDAVETIYQEEVFPVTFEVEEAFTVPQEVMDIANTIPDTPEAEERFSLKVNSTLEEKAVSFNTSNGNVPTEILESGNATIRSMVDIMLPFLDRVGTLGKRYLPEEVYGKGYSTIYKNASYGRTMENTLECIRTLVYNEFTTRIKEEIGRPLTVQESFLASQMLYDIATDPQCLYCYVSLDRKSYDQFLMVYIAERNLIVREYEAIKSRQLSATEHKEAVKSLYTTFLRGRKDTKPMEKRFKKWLSLVDKGSNLINLKDIATTGRRETLKAEGGDTAWQIADAERYAQSASWAKKNDGYRAYAGELLRLTKRTLDNITSDYGLRFYSFSEYTPAFIVENMQMVRDASVLGLKGFAYTKELDFVRIFAPSGMNINVSVYGRWSTDADGNRVMVEDARQGASWVEAQALREKYPNVGIVFVATEDASVEWAMAQGWTDVVIPFHIVRTGTEVADYYGWTNYSGMQADRGKGGRDIMPPEHHNDKETFLRLCAERGLTPRFSKWVDNPNYMKLVNETRRSVDETPTLSPVFDLDAAKASWKSFVNKGGYYGGWFKVTDAEVEDAIATVVADIEAGVEPNEVPYGRQDVDYDTYLQKSAESRARKEHQNNPLYHTRETDDARYSLRDTFYSNAENAVRLIKQEKATPEQWLKMIEKNGGLKAGEDKWLGLSDWLKEQMRGPVKEKPTAININGTEYNVKELEEQILSDIKAMLEEEGFEDELIGIRLVGSYMRGEQRPDSDIDVIVEYKGGSTEDTLFNVLNDEDRRINIGGVDVDINPITEGKSGTLDEWEKRNAGFTKKPITLTKDEVLQYIAENNIQIEEVSYGDVADISREEIYESAEFAELREGLTEFDEDDNPYIDRELYDELRSESYDFVDGFTLDYWGEELEIDSPAAAATYLGLTKADKEINETRLNYTTQGLSNKREIALTVPTIESWGAGDEIHFGDAGEGRAVAWIRFGETLIPKRKIKEVEEFEGPVKNDAGRDMYYPKGHDRFSKTFVVYGKMQTGEMAYVVYANEKPISKHNTLEEARIALNDYYKEKRITTGGGAERVLVIDEIQSKRHQEGREKGYSDKRVSQQKLYDAQEEAFSKVIDYESALADKYGEDEWASLASEEEMAEYERLRAIDEAATNAYENYDKGIPSAPFEKNWAELAMKRMLRYAAENGYDKVAWTTGEQQADRYDLGAVMQGLKAYKTSPNTYYVIPYNNGAIGEFVKEYDEKELAETFGKEIAVSIITNSENATEENPYEMTGDDLRIGGSGMRAFYDQMLPSFVRKYAKKWGATVGEVTMPNLEENNTMHSVDVTPAMRESVMQGQPLFSLKDNAEASRDVRLTPAEIRAHMFENITRHHEREVNRINRFFDAEIRKAERISKQQRKQNGEYPRNAKITVKLGFLMPQGKTAYPLEWQVIHDIANGLKVKWSDSKDGKKRGLATELGLGSSRKEKYGAITVGAQMYVEDYIAALVEENDGYVRGIDDNEVRNIVLDALSQYTRPKEALDALEQQFLVDEVDESLQQAIDSIERERATQLQAEEEKYEAQKNSYEKNPRKFERDYFVRLEKDVRLNNFKEMEIRSIKDSIQRLRTRYRDSRETRTKYLAEVKEKINTFLKDLYGRNLTSFEARTLINDLEKATSVENVSRIIARIERMSRVATNRIEQERKARLLRMKVSFFIPEEMQSVEDYLNQEKVNRADAAAFIARFEEGETKDNMTLFRAAFKDRYKGVDSKGVTVAKLIDAETATIMSFISRHAYDTTPLDALDKKREELYEEVERIKATLPFSETGKDKLDQAYEIVLDYITAMSKRSNATEIGKEAKALDAQLKEARENEDGATWKAIKDSQEALNKERASYLAEANELNMRANDAVERLLLNGKRLLSEEREAQRQHDKEVVRDVINDITNFGADYNELMAKSRDLTKQRRKELAAKAQGLVREWTDSFNQLLMSLAPYAEGGKGLVYIRFMSNFNRAASEAYENLEDLKTTINEAIVDIFGDKFRYNTLPKLMRRASEITLNEDIVFGAQEQGDAEVVPYHFNLTMANALYLIAVWGQAEGRVKLEANGVTQEDIDYVVAEINKRDARFLKFVEWVIQELLPSRRENRYNKVFREMTGRWMPYVENYFPIHILPSARHTEEKVSEYAGDNRSVSPSAIKERTYNTNMIDLNTDFFKALMENLYTMETWAAMAEIERDMNTIVSNNLAKDLMNARLGVDFADRLKLAMQVTMGTMVSGKVGAGERFFMDVTRAWGATKIGFRLNTALKQLSGAGALLAYTSNPKYLYYLAKNLIPTDAAEILPILKKRWEEGLVGNVGLKELYRGDTQISNWFDRVVERRSEIVSEVVKFGMIPNKVVDYYVCAVMAKSVYQFELERYKNLGYSDEVAQQRAMMDAEDSYNKTQQSSEMIYLSTAQVNPNLIYRGLNIFMNNSIANFRLGMTGIDEVLRGTTRFNKAQRYYRKQNQQQLYNKYIAQGMAEQDAKERAEEEAYMLTHSKRRMGYIANGLQKVVWGWWGSNLFFSLMGIAPYLIFGDDDENKKELIQGLWMGAIATPLMLIPWSKVVYDTFKYNRNGIANYMLPIMEDVDGIIATTTDIKTTLQEDEDVSWAQWYDIANAVARLGLSVDIDTFVNIADGVVDMSNGYWMEGTLDFLNVPKSQIRLLVGDRQPNETWEDYMTRILRTRSIIDKNKMDISEAMKFNPLTGKWEGEVNLTTGQKSDVREMYNEYQSRYDADILQRYRPQMTDWDDINNRYEEVVKDMGWEPNASPQREQYYEGRVYIGEMPKDAFEEMVYLQQTIKEATKQKDQFIGTEENYAKYLDALYQSRKQLIRIYDDNVK